MSVKRIFIKVIGTVQGVGFRPFVYNAAKEYNLMGWVNNNSEGVYIDLQGDEQNINMFLLKLKTCPPPLSKIENIIITEKENENYSIFEIKESQKSKNNITFVSPDIATCSECKNDILNPKNRRFFYAFTNCTNCGPRFSIIKDLPYDRDKTTMKSFIMCKSCKEEYLEPSNRRFHAQPNACSSCGPSVWLEDKNRNTLYTNESSIRNSTSLLKSGEILAIKGLGGFHLSCNAKNESAINKLRIRKNRPFKPFALMMRNLETVRKYCETNKIEEDLLTGFRKPIVLLNQIKNSTLPKNIAPFQKTLGVMLPYTPLHELLFQGDIEVLVMTSANIYGLPLEYENQSAIKNLSSISDYFLMHNRDINIPIDDSVVKVINEEILMFRRARGYTPEAFKLVGVKNILACGSNMKNTFSISRDNYIFLSHHIGDLENLETILHYERNIKHFSDMFSFKPDYVTCDLHPDYASTNYAKKLNLKPILIQHHHAHIASCILENDLQGKVIGVAYDGTGLGTDNKIWGGEFLVCDLSSFKRVAHLDYLPMSGGDKSINEPWRLGTSYVLKTLKKLSTHEFSLSEDHISMIKNLFGENSRTLIKLLEKNINCIETSSMGRLFDAAASIILGKSHISYEGEASIELEAIIHGSSSDYYPYKIIKDIEAQTSANYLNGNLEVDLCANSTSYIIEPYNIINGILNDKYKQVSPELMSIKFHNSIIKLTVDTCKLIRDNVNINTVALSGGVFQNSYLLKNLLQELNIENFFVYSNKLIPSNDGGISIGQLAITNSIIRDLQK